MLLLFGVKVEIFAIVDRGIRLQAAKKQITRTTPAGMIRVICIAHLPGLVYWHGFHGSANAPLDGMARVPNTLHPNVVRYNLQLTLPVPLP
jgi:hypothetical protein